MIRGIPVGPTFGKSLPGSKPFLEFLLLLQPAKNSIPESTAVYGLNIIKKSGTKTSFSFIIDK